MGKFFMIILLLSTLLSCYINSSNVNSTKISGVCDSIMNFYQQGKVEAAVGLLRQYSVISSASLDTLSIALEKGRNNLISRFGKIISNVQVQNKSVGGIILRRYYILKLEKYYWKFVFSLYFNGYIWTITNLDSEGSISELLQEQ